MYFKLFLSGFILIAFTSVKSQSISEEFISQIQKTNSFKKFKKILHTAEKDSIFSVTNGWVEQPNYKVKRTYWELGWYPCPPQNKYDGFNILIVQRNNKIVYRRIVSCLNKKVNPERFDTSIYINKDYTNTMLKKIEKKHGVLLSYQDMYEIFPSIFSAYCGGIFSLLKLTNEMETIFKAVIKKDSIQIIKECISFSNIRQCYGAAGLYLLERTGNTLNIQEKEIFSSITNANNKISHGEGGGCEIPYNAIKEVLTPTYLEYVYNKFLDYKKNTQSLPTQMLLNASDSLD